MNAFSNSRLRTACVAVAILSLAAPAATAKPKPYHASFKDTWLSSPVGDSLGFVGLQLDISAFGRASEMAGPTVMLTNDHIIKFRPSADVLPSVQPSEIPGLPGQFVPAGAGTYTIRDHNGDALVVLMTMQQQPVGPDGIIHFSGPWEVLSGTGRFANAKGGGTWTGWAKADDPVALMTTGFAGGIGGAEMEGIIDLHETPVCHGKN